MKEHIEDILVGGRPMTKLEKANKEIEKQKEIIRQLDIKNLELTTIIKEVKELLSQEWYTVLRKRTIRQVLEILDKVNSNENEI